MKSRFTGIWPALVTPFRNGEVHPAALRGLIHCFQNAGVSGLVICGTSGEAASLSPDERLTVLDTVIECGSGLPLIMGLAGNNLADVLAELKIVQSRPIAGVLVPPPYYVRPSQQGIKAFYDAIVQAASVPLILYNIPYRTGVPLELGTIRELARYPAVCAIKDCGGDATLTMQLISDGQLDVLAGEDLQIFSTLCLGGSGAISAAANVRPDLFARMAIAIQAGELAVARQLLHALRPMISDLSLEPNPAPVKAALAELGLIDNELRAPMVKASLNLAASITRHLNRLEEMDQG